VLDFPFFFLLVKAVGAERIGKQVLNRWQGVSDCISRGWLLTRLLFRPDRALDHDQSDPRVCKKDVE
jgi:hypothetical protein